MLPRLALAVLYSTFVLIRADRLRRSGLELVSAMIVLTHMEAFKTHGLDVSHWVTHVNQVYTSTR